MLEFALRVLAVSVFWLISTTRLGLACSDVSVAPFPAFPPTTIDHCYGADGWNYNRSLISRHYGLYAAMASDAYVDDWQRQRAFRLDERDLIADSDRAGRTGWTRLPRSPAFANGLGYDVYYNRRLPRPGVVVAFRGTDGLYDVDSFSNGSWLFGWFFCDQYCLAEKEFGKILQAAHRALGATFDVVVTGHSLGGGLARHIATTFPNVTAVTFNSSFVTNTPWFGGHSPRAMIRIYETGEVFGELDRSSRKLWLRASSNTAKDADYRTNMTLATVGISNVRREHNMENLAAGLLRSAVLCRTERDAECAAPDAMSRLIYCRYLDNRPPQSAVIRDPAVCSDRGG